MKNKVRNNSDALKLSKIMRQNLHQVLLLLAEISKQGYNNFLITYFLHPEYAFFSIAFREFNPKTGFYKEMIKTAGNKKQYTNNAKRYIRISLESLKAYQKVKNRNTQTCKLKSVQEMLDKTISLLKDKKNIEAKKNLYKIYSALAVELAKNF